MAYCPELPFGILSFSSYVDIKTMNVISYDVEMNEYELLGVKSEKLINALKYLEIPHFHHTYDCMYLLFPLLCLLAIQETPPFINFLINRYISVSEISSNSILFILSIASQINSGLLK